jgi:hypothetical protein
MKAVIRDTRVDSGTRIAAMAELVHLYPAEAHAVLIEVAENRSESRDVLVAAGVNLSRLAHSGFDVTEFDLRNLSDEAMNSFCEWLPE